MRTKIFQSHITFMNRVIRFYSNNHLIGIKIMITSFKKALVARAEAYIAFHSDENQKPINIGFCTTSTDWARGVIRRVRDGGMVNMSQLWHTTKFELSSGMYQGFDGELRLVLSLDGWRVVLRRGAVNCVVTADLSNPEGFTLEGCTDLDTVRTFLEKAINWKLPDED